MGREELPPPPPAPVACRDDLKEDKVTWGRIWFRDANSFNFSSCHIGNSANYQMKCSFFESGPSTRGGNLSLSSLPKEMLADWEEYARELQSELLDEEMGGWVGEIISPGS